MQALTHSARDLVVVVVVVLGLAVKFLVRFLLLYVEHGRRLRWRGRGGLPWIVSKMTRWQASRASALTDKCRRPCGEHAHWLAVYIYMCTRHLQYNLRDWHIFVYSAVAYIVYNCPLHTMTITAHHSHAFCGAPDDNSASHVLEARFRDPS